MSPADQDPILAARRLPRSVQPDRDLWPEIEARLAEPAHGASVAIDHSGAKAPRPGLWIGMTGAGLAAACVLVWVTVGVPPGIWNDTTGDSGTEGVRPGGVAVSLGAPPELLEARAALAGHLYGQLAALPPDTQDVVLANLHAINNALDEIDRALEEAPDSGLTRSLLTSMYADQLTMLTDMNAMVRRASQETSL